MSDAARAAPRTTDADLGIRCALNVFIASTFLWVVIRVFEHLNPIWAISSMVAASDPKVDEAMKFFRGRLINNLIGCGTGLAILFVGGTSEWKVPIALAISVLVSVDVVRVPVMWRQAPITATIVVASGLMDGSKMRGMADGLKRVGEVILGCLVGLIVTYSMSRVWPRTTAANLLAPAESASADSA